MDPSSLYELSDGSPMNDHSSAVLRRHPYAIELPPNYYSETLSGMGASSSVETHSSSVTNCPFRREMMDNCAGARLYARILEFYVFRPDALGSRCPLAGCEEEFSDKQGMLAHLKGCRHMADGLYWCPTCHQWEKFRTRTGRRCSWNREPLGQKIVQKSRDVFRSLTGNSPVTQQAKVLCDQCSRCLETLTRDGHSSTSCSQTDSASLWQAEPGSSSQAELRPSWQLDAPQSPGELSGDSSPMGLQQRPVFTPAVSELSAEFISPNENLTDTVSSLDSLGHTEQPLTTCFSDPERLLSDFAPADNMFMAAHDTPNSPFQPPSLVVSPMILDPQAQAYTSMGIVLHHGPSNNSPFAELPATDIIFVDEQNSPDSSLQPSPLLAGPVMPSSQQLPSPTSAEEEHAESFKCPKCNYKPTGLPRGYKSYLRKHMDSKHGQPRSIPCEHCALTFTRRDNLTTHMRKKHSIDNDMRTMHSIDNACNLKRYRASSGSSRPAPPKPRTLRARSSQFN